MTLRAFVLSLVFVLAPSARAEPPTVPEAMQTHFNGERDEGQAWLAFGMASLAGGGILFDRNQPFERALSYPLLAFGAIETAIGLWLLGASDDRLFRLRRDFDRAPEAVRDRELARMRRTERTLHLLRYTEIAFIAGGTASAIAGGVTRQDLATGLGIGFAVESAVLLALDTFHFRRGRRYIEALSNFRMAIAPRPGGVSMVMAIGGSF